MRSGVLYISYDGMLEPLGQSQVLAYLERLAQDRPIHLISFEKAEDWSKDSERQALVARIALAGITWHPLRYHKKPSAVATAWDICQGVALAVWLMMRHRIGIVHARSYVASVMALAIKRMTGARFVFDMRGFWADERVDGGLWPADGRLYRTAKWFERQFFLRADHVVSLTHAAAKRIVKFPYLTDRCPAITVIPTCADLARFSCTTQASSDFVLGYVGSAGTWYEFDAVADLVSIFLASDSRAKFLVINRGDHGYIKERLERAGVPLSRVEVRSVSHAHVPEQMARMQAGVFFYKPSFSRAACAPTKLGEFLGCGIPCISNTGVGDMAEILRENRVGVAIDQFDKESLRTGLNQLLDLANDPLTRDRCVQTAQEHFSLEEGVRRYAGIYTSLESDT